MKIYQVEIHTEGMTDALFNAIGGYRPNMSIVNIKTFASKEKAQEFKAKCEESYRFLQHVAINRIQSMLFVVQEREITE